MWDSLSGHKGSDGLRKAPFLVETSSRNSSAHGYDILANSEKDTRSQRRTNFRRRAYGSIISILTALIVAETILLAWTSYVPHKGPVPSFAMHEKTFASSDEWEFSPVAYDLWENLIDDSGMVTIPNWKQFGLKPGLKTAVPGAGVYGVVFTHEFHCMRMIRNALVGLMTRDEGTMSELYVANTSVELPKGRLAHLFHCVDYLKQNILCEADTTLEWRSESNPEHVDGYGVPHQCRDWDEVRGWMVANHPIDPAYQVSKLVASTGGSP